MTSNNTNKLSGRVAEWYRATFPSDDLGYGIRTVATFNGLLKAMKKYQSPYDYLQAKYYPTLDSIVRERCFAELANRLGVEYKDIYDLWLADNPNATFVEVTYKGTIGNRNIEIHKYSDGSLRYVEK